MIDFAAKACARGTLSKEKRNAFSLVGRSVPDFAKSDFYSSANCFRKS